MKKRKKRILYLFSFLLLLCMGIILFINLDPAFGGNPTKEQKVSYTGLNNYVEGKFVNEIPTSLDMSLEDNLSMIRDSFAGAKGRNPDSPIPASTIDWMGCSKGKHNRTQ